MIRDFKSKGLSELWSTGETAKIDAKMYKRILVRLDALDAATKLGDLALPGFNFHPLSGFEPTRYSIHVNGPWCITFAFDETDVLEVQFEQYH